MACYEIDGIVPVIHPSAFVHPDAVLIGDVIIGPNCYVAPLASLRGDFGRIIMETGSNIQEGCVMHGFPGSDTVIEENGHVGHGAILHGCRVGKNALIGMNSVIMDNAIIGESAFVAASSFVKAGMEVPAKTLVAGTPAKVVRELSETEMKWKSEGTKTYQELAVRSKTTMKICTPLTEVEANRKRFESNLKSLIDTKNDTKKS